MNAGFLGRILRVDLTTGELSEEELRPDWARLFLGGTGLAARYFYAEVPAYVDPYGLENKLISMTGLLTGTVERKRRIHLRNINVYDLVLDEPLLPHPIQMV